MSYNIKDYMYLSTFTLREFVIGTAVIGSFTVVPAVLKYVPKVIEPLS